MVVDFDSRAFSDFSCDMKLLGYSANFFDKDSVKFLNSEDFCISIDFGREEVCKYWCDCPCDFSFSEFITISKFIDFFKE